MDFIQTQIPVDNMSLVSSLQIASEWLSEFSVVVWFGTTRDSSGETSILFISRLRDELGREIISFLSDIIFVAADSFNFLINSLVSSFVFFVLFGDRTTFFSFARSNFGLPF